MNEDDKKLLEKAHWHIDCFLPFQISKDDGSFMSGRAALEFIEYLRKIKNQKSQNHSLPISFR